MDFGVVSGFLEKLLESGVAEDGVTSSHHSCWRYAARLRI